MPQSASALDVTHTQTDALKQQDRFSWSVTCCSHSKDSMLPVLCRLGTADPNKGVLSRLWLVPCAS